jgi:hypothetical protein
MSSVGQARYSDGHNSVDQSDTLENSEYIVANGQTSPGWIYEDGLVNPEKRLLWRFAGLYTYGDASVDNDFLVLNSAQRAAYFCDPIALFRQGSADERLWIRQNGNYYYPVCSGARPTNAAALNGN